MYPTYFDSFKNMFVLYLRRISKSEAGPIESYLKTFHTPTGFILKIFLNRKNSLILNSFYSNFDNKNILIYTRSFKHIHRDILYSFSGSINSHSLENCVEYIKTSVDDFYSFIKNVVKIIKKDYVKVIRILKNKLELGYKIFNNNTIDSKKGMLGNFTFFVIYIESYHNLDLLILDLVRQINELVKTMLNKNRALACIAVKNETSSTTDFLIFDVDALVKICKQLFNILKEYQAVYSIIKNNRISIAVEDDVYYIDDSSMIITDNVTISDLVDLYRKISRIDL